MACSDHDRMRAYLIAVGWASPESTDEEVEEIVTVWSQRVAHAADELCQSLADIGDSVAQRLELAIRNLHATMVGVGVDSFAQALATSQKSRGDV